MARFYNTFDFTGTLGLPKSTDKLHQVNESASGWVGHRLNFAVQESKTNGVFVEMYGGYSKAKENKVFGFSKATENVKGSMLEIAWDDRLKEETLQMVADFKKIVIDFTTDEEVKKETFNIRNEIRQIEYIDDELKTDANISKLVELYAKLKEVAVDRHEFISEYDAVVFLAENIEKYKSHKFRVRGSVEYNYHQGKFFRKFKPTHIEIVDNEEVNKLRATFDLFFTKDSLDEKSFAKEKIIRIDASVIAYDGLNKKDQFFPQQVVINASKLDLENEMHVKRLDFLKKQFEVKSKKVNHLVFEVSVFRGSDTVEFTEKDLTKEQKEMIELGLNTIDDFKPKGGVLGEAVEENRVIKPLFKEFDAENDFRTGAKETTYKPEDINYVPSTPADKPKADEEKPKEDEKPAAADQLEDLDKLFG